VREPDEYTITFELENKENKKKFPIPELKKEKSNVEKKKEKKYETFTDTSKNKEDEAPSDETDRIGEKGSLAKGKNPDDAKSANNKPYADGQSKAPFLGKGEQGVSIENQQQSRAQEEVEQFVKKEEKSEENNVVQKSAQSEKKQEIQKEQVNIMGVQRERVTVKEFKKTQSGERQTEANKVVQTENDGKEQHSRKLIAEAGVRQEKNPEEILRREGIHVLEETRNSKNASKEKKGDLISESQEMQKTVKSENGEKTETEIKDDLIPPPSGVTGITQQNRTEANTVSQAISQQAATAEKEQAKVSFSVNAKDEGSGSDPILFEDTLSNAEIPGAPSFNVKQHKYAAYFKHIRQRISLYWFLGYGTRAEIKLETRQDKPIIIEFKVLPDGTIEKVNIVEDAGNFQLASRLVSSIKGASPLDPFPADMKEPSIDVRFNFFFF